MTKLPKRATVQDAQAALSRAADHLTLWRAGDRARNLLAGHNALTAIDDTSRMLQAARVQLVAELRAEQDATTARTGALLRHGGHGHTLDGRLTRNVHMDVDTATHLRALGGAA